MAVYTLDTQTIGEAIATVITTSIGIYVYLQSKGYLKIWRKKLTLDFKVVDAAHSQNGHALTKLNMSDEMVSFLQDLAPGPDGTIDEERAMLILHDCIKWNNHLICRIPKMNEIKKE